MGSCQAGPLLWGLLVQFFQVTAVQRFHHSNHSTLAAQGGTNDSSWEPGTQTRKVNQQLPTESRSARSPASRLVFFPLRDSNKSSPSYDYLCNCHEDSLDSVGLSDPPLPMSSRIGGGEFVPSPFPSPCGSPAPLRNLHRIENQQIHPPACHMTWLAHGNCFSPQVSKASLEPAHPGPLGQLGQLGRLDQLVQLIHLIHLDQSARRKTPFLKLRQPLAPPLVRAARQYRTPYVVNYRPRKQRRGWLRLRTRSPCPAPHAHTPTRPTRQPT